MASRAPHCANIVAPRKLRRSAPRMPVERQASLPELLPNTLYFGDNLDILRRFIPAESVDLIYLDPPFNSNQAYNVLFRERSGEESAAQIQAFTDTWHWDVAAERTYDDLITQAPEHVAQMISALRQFLGSSDMMAYLVMMAARLVELHRVLKPTGSLYLHCDPTASHYLKVILDTIFGPERFVNEVIWQRQTAHNDGAQGAKHFGRLHDVLLVYSKTDAYIWNRIYGPHSASYLATHYRLIEPETGRRYELGDMTGPGGAANGNPAYEVMGVTRHWRYSQERMQELIAAGRVVQPRPGAVPRIKRYLDESPGRPLQDIWDDITPLNSQAQERLGYPTQKPLALLERIIRASSNPGDLVLDPFCGCGTAIVAAEKLGRRWIGIDITHLAISIMKSRLRDHFGDAVQYQVEGEPVDLASARALANHDRYQFQWWAASLVGAQPVGGQKRKGADQGVDGVIPFVDDHTGRIKRCVVQVKSGHVSSATIRDLKGTIQGRAELGLLVTLEPPSQAMKTEALEAGFYQSPGWERAYPRIQIITVEELLTGTRPELPPGRLPPYAKAQRLPAPGHRQMKITDAQTANQQRDHRAKQPVESPAISLIVEDSGLAGEPAVK